MKHILDWSNIELDDSELISKYWNESLDNDVQIDLLNSSYISLI
jgi:hypothetical protein